MAKIDLHIHTNASGDGEFTPAEIIAMCKKEDIHTIAVTDHNSIRSVREAILQGKANHIKVIPGIEIDCTYQDMDFHLLGYGFRFEKPEFQALEEDIIRQEMNAAEEKIHKFRNGTGIQIMDKEVFDLAKDGIVTGELIAEIVLNKEDANKYEILKPYLSGRIKSDMPYVNLYWDYFSKGKMAYVPIQYMSMEEAKEMIHKNGGMAVLAHPGQNLKNNYSFIDSIIPLGIDGIEVFSSYHGEAETNYFYDKVKEYHLEATCGSDFHGKNKPNIKLGDCNLTIEEEEVYGGYL